MRQPVIAYNVWSLKGAAFVLCLALCGFLARPAVAESKAESTPVSSIAIIDVQRILQESLSAKSVQKQLEAQRAKFQAEISIQETKLHEADQKLKDERMKLSPDALTVREQQLRQQFAEVERDVQAKRHALDNAFTASMGTVRTGLLDIVQDIAKKRKISLVMLKQQALWYEPTLDITGEVLTQLNKKLPQVPVKVQYPPPKEEEGTTSE